MPKKNIALLTNMVTPYRVPFFKELAKKVKKLDILTCVDREVDREWDVKNSSDYNVLKLAGLTLNLNKGKDSKRILHFKFGIMYYLLVKRPDVLIIGDASWTSYIAAFACRVFFIDYIVWNEITVSSKVSGGFVDKLRSYLYSGAKRCIASCHLAKLYLLNKGVNENKISIVNNAVDNDFFLNEKGRLIYSRDSIRSRLNIKNGAYTFIYVGQLISRKRVIETLEAVSKMSSDYDVHLIVAGSGPLENAMKDKAEYLGFENVNFFGYATQKELCELYTASDALILISEDEPWGMVVNEALIFECQMYCSDSVAAAVEINNLFNYGNIYNSESNIDLKIDKKIVDYKAIINHLSPEKMADGFFKALSWLK